MPARLGRACVRVISYHPVCWWSGTSALWDTWGNIGLFHGSPPSLTHPANTHQPLKTHQHLYTKVLYKWPKNTSVIGSNVLVLTPSISHQCFLLKIVTFWQFLIYFAVTFDPVDGCRPDVGMLAFYLFDILLPICPPLWIPSPWSFIYSFCQVWLVHHLPVDLWRLVDLLT